MLAPLVALALVVSASGRPSPAAARPTVGAIRWDGWFADNPWEKNLAPAQWRSRLPFYARVSGDQVTVVSDSQAVMDREIAYAHQAGLGYWAFCYYYPTSFPGADSYNYGWRRYLASKHKGDLRFCLLLQGCHLGPKEEWAKTEAQFLDFFRQPTYQRVAGGRPLVYMFYLESLEKTFGSTEAARAAFDDLRAKSRAAGLGDPYLVSLLWPNEVSAYDALGFDAVGSYSAQGWGETVEHPYADLAAANRQYWETFLAGGKQVVPTVNAGWDGRPRDYTGPWYRRPTPSELADHLRGALAWVRSHPAATAPDTVLIYAWNESDEGGWLVPTVSEGEAHLRALRGVLPPARAAKGTGAGPSGRVRR